MDRYLERNRRVTSEPLGTRSDTSSYTQDFRAGVAAIVPFLFAVGPFALAMAVAAHGAGLTALEIVAMSAIVFAGAAQMAAISLLASGAGLFAIVLTTLLINLRHIVYGLSLDRRLPLNTRPARPLLAFVLIDESYGLAMTQGRSHSRPDAFYLGASLGIYVPFVLCTALGALAASRIPEVERFGLEFIFPLAFVGILMPLLKGHAQIATALVSGTGTLALTQVLDTGLAILLAIMLGAAAGTGWRAAP